MYGRSVPSGKANLISVLIYQTSFQTWDLGAGAAMSTVVLVIMMIFASIYLRAASRRDEFVMEGRATNMQGKPVIRHRCKLVTAGGVLCALAILGYLIFALFPVFIMISISFTDKYSIMGLDTPLWPENPITRNYVRIWESIPLLRYIKNSLIVCVATVVISLFLSVPASYGLSRFNFRGKQVFTMSTLATQLFPGITMLLPLYLIYVNITKVTGIPMTNTYHTLR